ncbi:MAG: hypothetical protein K940chlam9_00163 [Chlamydiae bacterium]|nr:hypothetical protein [Chlamydiota bacterium]
MTTIADFYQDLPTLTSCTFRTLSNRPTLEWTPSSEPQEKGAPQSRMAFDVKIDLRILSLALQAIDSLAIHSIKITASLQEDRNLFLILTKTPCLQTLETLHYSADQISILLENLSRYCPKLHTLKLGYVSSNDWNSLSSCPDLKNLSLKGVCLTKQMIEQTLSLFTCLTLLTLFESEIEEEALSLLIHQGWEVEKGRNRYQFSRKEE